LVIIGDCDHDGRLTSEDLDKIIQIFTRCATCPQGGAVASGCSAVDGMQKDCFAADLNVDGCISAGELSEIIAAAIQ
jgi:hypothetical protein